MLFERLSIAKTSSDSGPSPYETAEAQQQRREAARADAAAGRTHSNDAIKRWLREEGERIAKSRP